MADAAVLIVGGTSGIGLRLAETYAARGRDVVITGRDGPPDRHSYRFARDWEYLVERLADGDTAE